MVITLFFFWSLFFGLPIGEHKWNIDIIPPRIWDMNDPSQHPDAEEERKEEESTEAPAKADATQQPSVADEPAESETPAQEQE